MALNPEGGRIDVVALGNCAYRVTDGTGSRLAYAIVAEDGRWVFLDGRVFVVDVEDGSPAGPPPNLPAGAQPFRAARSPAASRKRRDSAGDLAAPMPATVVSITVAPGQRVSKGDVLIVLEAMKMELPITAPRDGAVKSIACRAGELVQPGVPLLELE